jgi:hypothetical protein
MQPVAKKKKDRIDREKFSMYPPFLIIFDAPLYSVVDVLRRFQFKTTGPFVLTVTI